MSNRNEGKTALAKKDFVDTVKRMGYTSSGYVKNKQQVEMRCDRGHTYKVTPSSFRTSCKCRTRHFEDVVEESRRSFVEYLDGIGYTLVGEFTGMRKGVEVVCDAGHTFIGNPSDITGNRPKRCRYCRANKFGSKYLYYASSACGRFVKIGSTNNPHSRQGTLSKQTPFEISELVVFEMVDGASALMIEELAHSQCINADLGIFMGHTEWFIKDNNFNNFLENVINVKSSI